MAGWIGVDLDGTLAKYDGWVSPDHIGEPVPAMVKRIKQWLGQGYEVRVFTARAYKAEQGDIDKIQDWCEKHIGFRLKVTNEKDYGMVALYDDRAYRVEMNTGVIYD